jgi:hypothetical protein
MEESELITIWRSYDKKLEKNLILNRQNAAAITLIKIKSLMSSMAPKKIILIIASVLWVIFLSIVLYNTFTYVSPFFWFSICIHVLMLTWVIGIYMYQVILIFQTDISETLIKTQHRLASLKSSTLLISRLMFLHAPVWSTFCIQEVMFSNPMWLTIQTAVTLVFVVVALWLFINIKYENRDKKWFRFIFKGNNWDPVIKSIEMLREIEGYNLVK